MTTAICEKCGRRDLVSFQVEPRDAWQAVVRNRWKTICPSCFDAEAEVIGVRFHFLGTRARSWSELADPPRRSARSNGRTPVDATPTKRPRKRPEKRMESSRLRQHQVRGGRLEAVGGAGGTVEPQRARFGQCRCSE